MAELCRRLEKKYELQEVLSPRRFQSPKDRLLPRFDSRKEKLKADIQNTLKSSGSYSVFERQMQNLGYKILKGRGISFIDDKKVKIKGSEVGFSLMKIENMLKQMQQTEIKNSCQAENYDKNIQSAPNFYDKNQSKTTPKQFFDSERIGEETFKNVSGLIDQLMHSEHDEDHVDAEFEKMLKKKKKRSLRR